MTHLNEAQVEIAIIDYFRELCYECVHGQDIAPGDPLAERESYSDVVLRYRLESVVGTVNPKLLQEAKDTETVEAVT